jgi:hypothetical protein
MALPYRTEKARTDYMWKAIFFSTGLFVLMWGASFLVVDKITLTLKEELKEEAEDDAEEVRAMFTSVNADNQKVFDPPDWAAFSLMSVGAVTMLYSVALPKKG